MLLIFVMQLLWVISSPIKCTVLLGDGPMNPQLLSVMLVNEV